MAHRPGQLLELNAFKRSVPHVSGRALAAILQRVREHGMPDRITRRDQQEARDVVAHQHTPYGPLQRTLQLQGLEAGTQFNLEIVNPQALLYTVCLQGGSFATWFKSRLLENPSTPADPWHLILYSDGITPGDPFKTGNERKVEAVYFSMKELGMQALCHEDAWFTLVSKSSAHVAKTGGSMSQVIAQCLRQFFNPPHDMRRGGIMLTFGDGTRLMLFLILEIFVQDELAHKMIWSCKGASGTRSCMVCMDYAEGVSELDAMDGTNFVRSRIADPYALNMHTDMTVRAIVRRLRAHQATDSADQFDRRQQVLGFNHTEHSILLADDLVDIVHPVSQYVHDWMHVAMVGVFQLVVYLVMEVLRPVLRYDAVHTYMQLWTWPRAFGGTGNAAKKAFDAKHETSSRKAASLKVSASDGLSLFPVLAHFFRRAVLPNPTLPTHMSNAVNVFLALVLIIELLQNTARGSVTPASLRNAIFAFMTAFVTTFGWERMITKFHALLHLVNELQRHGVLPSCWVHERKHKTIKRYAQDIMNGGAYERSLLSEVTAHHLNSLLHSDTFDFSVGLVRPRPASRRLLATITELFGAHAHAMEGLESRIDAYSVCFRGDVVLLHDGDEMVAGDVWAHLEIGGVPVSIIDLYEPLEMHVDQQYCTWRKCDNPLLFETENIMAAVIWSQTDDIVTTLLPRR